MDYKSLLNQRQYEAVTTPNQFVRIVAGAGSGKTRVLTYRISYLISEMGVRPHNILAIAFTNKVANEMKERALSLLNEGTSGLRVLTFHSFCARFLRTEIGVLGFPDNYIILDEQDQKSLLKSIVKQNGFSKTDELVKNLLSYIGHNKTQGKYPCDIKIKDQFDEDEKTLLKFYSQYEKRKNEMHALDFDDLLLRTIQILEDFPDIRDRWQNKFKHILIDEFQDTNDVQYHLVKLLRKKDTSLYVVGDPDQTIYTWRGANQDIIMNFEHDFKNAETIVLDRNYRSTKCILDVANKLISNNEDRVKKDLYTNNNDGEPVSAVNCFSRNSEAKYVVDEIEKLKRKDSNFSYNQVAILYRASYLTLPFEKELMMRQVPYRIYGGVKFFERKEVKDVLAYFRLIYNPDDDISFERIINVPKRGIGDKTLAYLKEERDLANMSYIEYLKHVENYDTKVASKHILSLTMLIAKIDHARQEIADKIREYPAILSDFIKDLGFYDYLNNSDDEVDRVGNVKTLLDDVKSFAENHPDEEFNDYLENAALQTSQDEIDGGDYVSLMTIHVAKGLEFPYVFIISLNEGVFPSEKTLLESGHRGLEEERRLCYVAFTRAKKKLNLSTNRSFNFITNDNACFSRFFAEAGLSPRFLYSENKQSYQTIAAINHKMNTLFGSGFESDLYDDDDDDETFVEEEVKTNNIDDWEVGDLVEHKTFGEGEVIDVDIDDDPNVQLLTIDFKLHGKKMILGNHQFLSRKKEGRDA